MGSEDFSWLLGCSNILSGFLNFSLSLFFPRELQSLKSLCFSALQPWLSLFSFQCGFSVVFQIMGVLLPVIEGFQFIRIQERDKWIWDTFGEYVLFLGCNEVREKQNSYLSHSNFSIKFWIIRREWFLFDTLPLPCHLNPTKRVEEVVMSHWTSHSSLCFSSGKLVGFRS